MRFTELREEGSAPYLARSVGTLENVITVFRFATVKAMCCGQGIIPVGPLSGREKIVA
jgi:hypothetical protein